jgi:hypothetical protein
VSPDWSCKFTICRGLNLKTLTVGRWSQWRYHPWERTIEDPQTLLSLFSTMKPMMKTGEWPDSRRSRQKSGMVLMGRNEANGGVKRVTGSRRSGTEEVVGLCWACSR